MSPSAFALGPMHVPHISGRSMTFGVVNFDVICLCCSLTMGKALKESKLKESMNIVLKGAHVENRRVLEKPDAKSVTITSAWYSLVVGGSISINSPPDCGFDIVCPDDLGTHPSIEIFNIIMQGKHLHGTTLIKEDVTLTTNNKDDETTKDASEKGVDENWKKAVIGNDGVAGIKIKGGDIDLEIEAPAKNENPATTTTPIIAPQNADELVANNHGVAGIDLEATGNVKVNIGKVNSSISTTKEDGNNTKQIVSD